VLLQAFLSHAMKDGHVIIAYVCFFFNKKCQIVIKAHSFNRYSFWKITPLSF